MKDLAAHQSQLIYQFLLCLLIVFVFLSNVKRRDSCTFSQTPESLLLRRRDALFRLPTTELDSAGECAKCKVLAETDNADQPTTSRPSTAPAELSGERKARPLFKSRVRLARASHKPLNKLVFRLCSCLSDVRVSRRHKRSSNATR